MHIENESKMSREQLKPTAQEGGEEGEDDSIRSHLLNRAWNEGGFSGGMLALVREQIMCTINLILNLESGNTGSDIMSNLGIE